ncbi:B-cell linker protein-like isoform X3 [Lineus longissimus]|uniref:B-cell linker protein-like isoform X3 n=1 Tax=Lineus longissimus TaxID=88925 RepID=UPI00315D0E0C
MSLPNTNELQTWNVDRVSQWLTRVGLSDCIETFRNRDIDGKTLSKYNEGKCMSLTGISMKMKRELWRHVNAYIEENPPLGSRPQSKIIPKSVQKLFGGTSVSKVSKTLPPPIDYSNTGDDSDGESWPEDEFDSEPDDFDEHPNHASLSYETPSEPAQNTDDFYELPWDDPLAQKYLDEKLRRVSEDLQQSSSGCSSLLPHSLSHNEAFNRQFSQDLGSDSDQDQLFSYDRRISDVYGSETDLFQSEYDQEPHQDDDGHSPDEDYEQPTSAHPSPSKFTAIGLSPIHKPTKSRVPDPEPEADEFYEMTDFESDTQIKPFTKSSTMPSSVPPIPAPIKSRTLPPAPTPIKPKDGPKRTIPTPPDSRSNSLSSSSSIPGSPQFPRSPKLGKLPPAPFRRPGYREPRTSVTSISSSSSESGSGVVGPPPLPPRIPLPPPPLPRPEPPGQEDKPAPRRGSIPLPMPPVPSVPDDTEPDILDGLYAYPWFHGSVGRDYANKKLPLLPEDGTFLVRKSTHGPHQPYSLDILYESTIKRLPIRLRRDGKYALGKEKDGEQSFAGVADLIVYHKEYPIFVVGSAGAEVTLKRTPPK